MSFFQLFYPTLPMRRKQPQHYCAWLKKEHSEEDVDRCSLALRIRKLDFNSSLYRCSRCPSAFKKEVSKGKNPQQLCWCIRDDDVLQFLAMWIFQDPFWPIYQFLSKAEFHIHPKGCDGSDLFYLHHLLGLGIRVFLQRKLVCGVIFNNFQQNCQEIKKQVLQPPAEGPSLRSLWTRGIWSQQSVTTHMADFQSCSSKTSALKPGTGVQGAASPGQAGAQCTSRLCGNISLFPIHNSQENANPHTDWRAAGHAFASECGITRPFRHQRE